MALFPPRRTLRTTFGAALLTVGLVADQFTVHTTHAAVACRADPVVWLTNDAHLDQSADIYDAASDVTGASFTLHGPAGVRIDYVSYPQADPLKAIETFRYVADGPPRLYVVQTLVQTRTPNMAVTAYTQLGRAMFSASGLSGQSITVQARRSSH